MPPAADGGGDNDLTKQSPIAPSWVKGCDIGAVLDIVTNYLEAVRLGYPEAAEMLVQDLADHQSRWNAAREAK